MEKLEVKLKKLQMEGIDLKLDKIKNIINYIKEHNKVLIIKC